MCLVDLLERQDLLDHRPRQTAVHWAESWVARPQRLLEFAVYREGERSGRWLLNDPAADLPRTPRG